MILENSAGFSDAAECSECMREPSASASESRRHGPKQMKTSPVAAAERAVT